MTLFEVDDTLTVGQVTRRIAEAIKRSFRGEVWVHGQIRNLSRSARGHVYFDLIEPVPAGAAPKASVPVTLFDSNRQIVNRIITRTGNSMRIDDGVEVRIRGTVEHYAPRGQVQINMTSIDPEFTLGRLGADREQLLRDLRSEDLVDANGRIDLPLVPLRIALITSDCSAAHADFTKQLTASGYRFEVHTIPTRVQGEFAPDEIAASIAGAERLAVDVIALVRGGGARTDLAAFDTEPVARAIAGCSLPVVCGIGHEIDEAVADLVAHASFKTPTACAQFLVERVVAFDFELARRAQILAERSVVVPLRQRSMVDDAARAVADHLRSALDGAQQRNAAAAASLERRVSRRITRAHHHLGDVATRVRLGAQQALVDADRRCAESTSSVRDRPAQLLREATRELDLFAARVTAVDPVHAMRRGWSITTTSNGRAVRSIGQLAVGDAITTRLADGMVTSTVAGIDDSVTPTPAPIPDRNDHDAS